jgi:tetratricopeptide (TPR) repeat protein
MMRPNWIVLGVISLGFLLGADPPPDPPSEDAARFDAITQRYRQALRKRPYRGSTFDHWYRHYLDAGKLDSLVAEVESAAKTAPDDPSAQLVLGLVYERKSRDDDAVRAYTAARKLAPDRYEPPALLGTLLARLVRFGEAAPALAEAIRLNPPRSELLELVKRLGQCYQRLGKTNEAIATWSGLVEKFPNDRRVRVELAELLADEGLFGEAIERWEQVVSLAGQDLDQKLTAQLAIAQLLTRMEKYSEALQRLTQVLDAVEPDSWRAKEVHRRIESVFLERNDLPGLVGFYTERCRLRPDDVASVLQRSAALIRSRQLDEAINGYRAAIAVAPSRRDLREALIAALEQDGRLADALAECRALADKTADDPEVQKRLGHLILKSAPDDRRNEAEREAVDVWARIAASRPNDATAALEVADLCRREGSATNTDRAHPPTADSILLKAAEAQYREAIRRS